MELKWTDVNDIAIELADSYPGIEPYTVSFVTLHDNIMKLASFTDESDKSNEKILEAIQAAWIDELE